LFKLTTPTRAFLESGLLREERDRYALDRPIRSFAIPPSLHASLLARLDRLGPAAKEMAQIGAAIGRDFSYELLAAVAQRSESELKDPLTRLADTGLVFQRGTPPDAIFLFKHALVQDAAYSTLLRGRRQSLHARIARVLEERFPSVAEIQPQTLAQHYAEAGMVEKSVAWWGKAGYRSAARSGMAEAVAQFQKALDQLVLLPGTLNSSDRSSNFVARWARRCVSSKVRPPRKPGRFMPAHESCGSSWVPRPSTSIFPMGWHAITRTAGNWISRCA